MLIIISLAQSLDLFTRPFSGLSYVINQQIRKYNERIGTRKLMETNKFRYNIKYLFIHIHSNAIFIGYRK